MIIYSSALRASGINNAVSTFMQLQNPSFNNKVRPSQECAKFGYQRITANTTHMLVEFVTTPHGEVVDTIVVPVWGDNGTEAWGGGHYCGAGVGG